MWKKYEQLKVKNAEKVSSKKKAKKILTHFAVKILISGCSILINNFIFRMNWFTSNQYQIFVVLKFISCKLFCSFLRNIHIKTF